MKKLFTTISTLTVLGVALFLFTLPVLAQTDVATVSADQASALQELQTAREAYLGLQSSSSASATDVQAAWERFRLARDNYRNINNGTNVANTNGTTGNGQKLRKRDGSNNGVPQRTRKRDGSGGYGTVNSTTVPSTSLSATPSTCDGTGITTGQGQSQGQGMRRGQGGGQGRGQGRGRNK